MFFFTNNQFYYKIYGDSLQFVCNSCTSTLLLKWNKIRKTDKKNTTTHKCIASVMDDVPAFCKTCEVNSPYFIHHVNKGVLIVWCQSGSYVCHIISLSGSYVSYHMIIWNLCVIWYPYLEIMYHILFLSGSYMSYHMFIWKLCVKFCKVPQLCIWSACTKWGEWMVMYMCVRCIDFTSVTMIFWLEVIWHCHIFCFSF
jgi:hypothetical protein